MKSNWNDYIGKAFQPKPIKWLYREEMDLPRAIILALLGTIVFFTACVLVMGGGN